MAASRSSPAHRRAHHAGSAGNPKALPASGAQFARSTRVAWWFVAAALGAAAWLVDPFAEASFDAPKWLCVMICAVGASAALLANPVSFNWRAWSPAAKATLVAAAAELCWMLLSAFSSTHTDLAWPSLRGFVLMALFAPIGASAVLDGAAGKRMFIVFIAACASNAILSLAQSGGLALLPIAQVGGRFDTGALLGNEGYVALACAMMAAASIACAIDAASLRKRLAFALIAALGSLVIVLNQQKTSAIALAGACVVVVAVRWRVRWLIVGLPILLLSIAASLSVPSLRAATWGTLPISDYQRITTYRLGAWIAAADMAIEQPWTGYGPGTFAAEVQPHRLAAEIKLRERLVPPTAASFVQAHQDYLQLAAEAGIPALLLFLGAALALFADVALRAVRTLEQQVLLAITATGMIGALAWFPMHIPFIACVLLLCAGRMWRLSATPPAERAP